LPGERITEAQMIYIRGSMKLGVFPYDASDMDLHAVRVVA
jgi:hypothetical protein